MKKLTSVLKKGNQLAAPRISILFTSPKSKRVRSNTPPRPNVPPGGNDSPPWLTIVGVVSNTPVRALAEVRPTPLLYMPMSVSGGPNIPPAAMLGPNVATMSYIVRSAAEPVASMPEVRRAIDSLDSNLALAQMQTLQEILDGGSAPMSFTMVLLTIAAATALILGVIGIYGVVSYIVSQRTAEIGIRLALGAQPRTLMRMIVLQSGRVVLVGISAGIAAAAAGGRFIEALLYGVESPRSGNLSRDGTESSRRRSPRLLAACSPRCPAESDRNPANGLTASCPLTVSPFPRFGQLC